MDGSMQTECVARDGGLVEIGEPIDVEFEVEEEPRSTAIVRLATLEDVIDSKVETILADERESRLLKLRAKEQANLERKVKWRTKAGKPSNDEFIVESYCRRRWPLHFEAHKIDDARLDKALEKRVAYEKRAADYFKFDSESQKYSQLDILEHLVDGAPVKTGLLGSLLNRTANRFDILVDYFTQSNVLEITSMEECSHLELIKDKIETKLNGSYWNKQIFKNVNDEELRDRMRTELKTKAKIVVNHIKAKLDAYTTVLAVRQDDALNTLYQEFTTQKDQHLSALMFEILPSVDITLMTNPDSLRDCVAYARDIFDAVAEREASEVNGRPIDSWKRNKFVRESIERCAEGHPTISSGIRLASTRLIQPFLGVRDKLKELEQSYHERRAQLATEVYAL